VTAAINVGRIGGASYHLRAPSNPGAQAPRSVWLVSWWSLAGDRGGFACDGGCNVGAYLSQVLRNRVETRLGEPIGRCLDLLALDRSQGPLPLAAVLIETDDGDQRLVPADQMDRFIPTLVLKAWPPPAYTLGGGEIHLGRDILDRQIVDVEGRRLVRVNDLRLNPLGPAQQLYVTGAAVGTVSLLRRLGLQRVVEGLLRPFGKRLTEQVIPWDVVAAVEPDQPIRLRVARDKIRHIAPADIADLVTQMDGPSGLALLQSLDDETVADAMQEIPDELQESMLSGMSLDRAADVLEEMDPDEAADLLGALEDERRSTLLEAMEDQDSVQVAKLLAYPEDTAGGIMTTEFTTIPQGMTAGQALAYLRTSPQALEDETLYNLHVVSPDGKLQGVISLRDLVMADPDVSVDVIADTQPITVELLTPQREVARLVAKYNLIELPVVDDEGILHGIVTVDDAIDAIIPTAWKKRIPRLF